jgi:hypothetical protein
VVSVLELALDKLKAERPFFLLVIWTTYFAAAYFFLVPFSFFRDYFGLASAVMYYSFTFILAFLAVFAAYKPNGAGRLFRVAATITAISLVLLSSSTLKAFVGCFDCKGFAALRIVISAVSERNVAAAQPPHLIFKAEYQDGDYSIIRFDPTRTRLETFVASLTTNENVKFYVLFDNYLIISEWVPRYLEPFGPGTL